jgi:hypothetical protein
MNFLGRRVRHLPARLACREPSDWNAPPAAPEYAASGAVHPGDSGDGHPSCGVDPGPGRSSTRVENRHRAGSPPRRTHGAHRSRVPHHRRGRAGPGGPDEDTTEGFTRGGWIVPFADEDFGAIGTGWFGRAEAILLGRTTYSMMHPYWSQVTDPDNLVAAKLNGLPKYVASSTLRDPGLGQRGRALRRRGRTGEAAQAAARRRTAGTRQPGSGAQPAPGRPHRRVPPAGRAG